MLSNNPSDRSRQEGVVKAYLEGVGAEWSRRDATVADSVVLAFYIV